jgi:YD repeat-containing protein
VLTQTDPMGNVTKFTYGPDSTTGITAGQTLVTDPAGHKNLYTSERVAHLDDQGMGATGASTWSYAYDPITLGVAVQTNPDGTTQTYSYDDHGRKISSSDGLGRTTSYQYDAAGNVTKTVDPTGLQTATVYNAAESPPASPSSPAPSRPSPRTTPSTLLRTRHQHLLRRRGAPR